MFIVKGFVEELYDVPDWRVPFAQVGLCLLQTPNQQMIGFYTSKAYSARASLLTSAITAACADARSIPFPPN